MDVAVYCADSVGGVQEAVGGLFSADRAGWDLMAVCRVRSLSLFGIDALPVEVEVDVSAGLPGFSIVGLPDAAAVGAVGGGGAGLPGFSSVGLPDAAVQEARERVRVAISNSGYKFPTKKLIVNLAPAGLRKEGGAFDLPMA